MRGPDGSMMTSFQAPKGDYGFDNPSGIFVLGGVVLVFWAFALVQALLGHWILTILGGFLGLFPLATLVSYIYLNATGKAPGLVRTVGRSSPAGRRTSSRYGLWSWRRPELGCKAPWQRACLWS